MLNTPNSISTEAHSAPPDLLAGFKRPITTTICELTLASVMCLSMSVIHCPALNMAFAEVNSTDTQFGVTVNISCLPGYRASGQTTSTVHCTNTGHWSLNASCLRTFIWNDFISHLSGKALAASTQRGFRLFCLIIPSRAGEVCLLSVRPKLITMSWYHT